MSIVYSINLSTPFLVGVPSSQVSREWLQFLSSVVVAVNSNTEGNISSGDTATLFLTAYTRPPQSELDYLKKRITALERQVATYHKTASGALAVEVNDDNATNANLYPVLSNGFASKRRMKTSSVGLKYNPSTGLLNSKQLQATTGFGCNSKTPQTAFSLGSAATDLASVITLANNLRTMSINNGTGA